ncbi:MAG: SdrD B-like domain-containing protein, partial [Burkholderiales bacterium]
PTVAKSLLPASIAPGGISVLTLTLGNTNASIATLSSALTDSLPAGVSVATPNGLGGTCTGGVTAVAGSGSVTYNNGGTIPANGSCTILVNVTSSTPGTVTNTIAAGALQTSNGNNAAATSAPLTVSSIITGTVFNDTNGLTDATINGTGTNAASTNLTAYLVSGGNVVGSSPVAADGTYSINNVANGTYSVVLSNTSGIANGSPAPAASLPAGWVNTGEGTVAAGDGTVNGTIATVTVSNASVAGANFGIEQPPVAGGTAAPSVANPGGTTSVPVPASAFTTGSSDTAPGTIASYLITAFPSNATSITINGTTFTAATFATATPAQRTVPAANIGTAVSVDPIDGSVTVAIPFQVIDNAGVPSANTGSASLPFNAPPVANPDTATTPLNTPVTLNVPTNDTTATGTVDSTTVDLDPATPGIQKAITVAGQGTFVADPVTGVVTFTPVTGFTGVATTPYTIQNSIGITSIPAPITVTIQSAIVTGHVFTDTNGNGTQEAGEPNLANVPVVITTSDNKTITVKTDAAGNYSALVPPGATTANVTDPVGNTLTTANDPQSVTAPATGTIATTPVGFQPQGVVAGHVFNDINGDGIQQPGEANLPNVPVVITTSDGKTITVTTNATGDYTSPVPAGPTTVNVTDPTGTKLTTANDPQTVNVAVSTTPTAATPVGFQPLSAGITGNVWRDVNHDRTLNSGEPAVGGFRVEVLNANGTVVASTTTDTNGNYTITNIPASKPGDPATYYTVRFVDPATGVVYGKPISADPANPNGDTTGGVIAGLQLNPGITTVQQSLPLDPSGVVYNSQNRQPVPGATVTISGPPGFDPASQLLGGSTNATQTTGANGFYQFILLPGAPAGDYTITVVPPAGYVAPSTVIPAETTKLDPTGLGTGGIFPVQPQPGAPVQGAGTTYYLGLTLAPGDPNVVNNHIPIDPLVATTLFVQKTASTTTAQEGDSVLYTVRVKNAAGPALTNVAVKDRLPAGFRYIPGTSNISVAGASVTSADPAGGVGPTLTYTIPNLPANGEAILTYRVRIGVGATRGDGINRVVAQSGNVISNEARAAVKVSGGVFSDKGIILGKVYVECNADRVQNTQELGIPGVRLYLQDGSYAITDVEGKYSFAGLNAKTHVILVDETTMPVGAKLKTLTNRNAGDPVSQFVDLKFGEMHRADFAEGTCSDQVLDQVKARRALGEVDAPETEKSKQPGLIFRSGGDKADQPMPQPRLDNPDTKYRAPGVAQ